MSTLYPDSLTAVHFSMFPLVLPDDLDQSKCSPQERSLIARAKGFESAGMGYFVIQSTKVRLL